MDYVLRNEACKMCVWGENGPYNAKCAHCIYCSYGKSESKYFTREMAEFFGLVEVEENDGNRK